MWLRCSRADKSGYTFSAGRSLAKGPNFLRGPKTGRRRKSHKRGPGLPGFRRTRSRTGLLSWSRRETGVALTSTLFQGAACPSGRELHFRRHLFSAVPPRCTTGADRTQQKIRVRGKRAQRRRLPGVRRPATTWETRPSSCDRLGRWRPLALCRAEVSSYGFGGDAAGLPRTGALSSGCVSSLLPAWPHLAQFGGDARVSPFGCERVRTHTYTYTRADTGIKKAKAAQKQSVWRVTSAPDSVYSLPLSYSPPVPPLQRFLFSPGKPLLDVGWTPPDEVSRPAVFGDFPFQYMTPSFQ